MDNRGRRRFEVVVVNECCGSVSVIWGVIGRGIGGVVIIEVLGEEGLGWIEYRCGLRMIRSGFDCGVWRFFRVACRIR